MLKIDFDQVCAIGYPKLLIQPDDFNLKASVVQINVRLFAKSRFDFFLIPGNWCRQCHPERRHMLQPNHEDCLSQPGSQKHQIEQVYQSPNCAFAFLRRTRRCIQICSPSCIRIFSASTDPYCGTKLVTTELSSHGRVPYFILRPRDSTQRRPATRTAPRLNAATSVMCDLTITVKIASAASAVLTAKTRITTPMTVKPRSVAR